ncbi:hypothetical protein GCM10023203_53800 [Actinomycetospora straminea]|uniref:Uncharacterized protein n=1 Tax=Actinomycetospora straminea TaxID=663607 RepID=A0ABP9F560_9PSEU
MPSRSKSTARGRVTARQHTTTAGGAHVTPAGSGASRARFVGWGPGYTPGDRSLAGLSAARAGVTDQEDLR